MSKRHKSDYSVFVYSPQYDYFYCWTKGVDRDYRHHRDINLHEYLPLTSESVAMLSMTHPSIDIASFQMAIKSWEGFTVDGQGYYVYNILKDCWE